MNTTTLLSRLGTTALAVALAFCGACGGDDDDDEASPGTSVTSTTTTLAAATATTAAPAATSSPAATGAATTVPLLTAPAASANPNTITIQNFAYTGLDAARANTTWSIGNRDTVAHTISADDGSFAWRVEPGQTTPFAKTLGPGSYAIHCDVHPNAMRGVLVVF